MQETDQSSLSFGMVPLSTKLKDDFKAKLGDPERFCDEIKSQPCAFLQINENLAKQSCDSTSR